MCDVFQSVVRHCVYLHMSSSWSSVFSILERLAVNEKKICVCLWVWVIFKCFSSLYNITLVIILIMFNLNNNNNNTLSLIIINSIIIICIKTMKYFPNRAAPTMQFMFYKGSCDYFSWKWNLKISSPTALSTVTLMSSMYEKSALVPQSSFSPVTSYHGLCHCILQPWIMTPPHKLTISHLNSIEVEREREKRSGITVIKLMLASCSSVWLFKIHCSLLPKNKAADRWYYDKWLYDKWTFCPCSTQWQRLSNLQKHQPHTLQK